MVGVLRLAHAVEEGGARRRIAVRGGIGLPKPFFVRDVDAGTLGRFGERTALVPDDLTAARMHKERR